MMVDTAKEYWTGTQNRIQIAAPNSCLFRFLGNSGFTFPGKNVLEVGFGYGADLLEAQRQGANIYGVDINQSYIDAMKSRAGLDTFVFADASKDDFGFGVKFDAIYTRDMIYYPSDDEISAVARHCANALSADGRIVVHFIQSDWKRIAPPSNPTAPVEANEWDLIDGSFSVGNPLRILDPVVVATLFEAQGLRLIGRKTMSETYGILEEYMRCQRYFMFSLA